LFDSNDFRSVIKEKVASFPSNGRGVYVKLAGALGIHTTSMSQIISGKKNLSMEHAALICDFLSFSDQEAEYFLLLVQLDRAGQSRLRDRLEIRLEQLRSESKELSNIVPSQTKLRLAQQAVFYSDWHYSAIRVLTSIDQFQTIDEISLKLNISKSVIESKVKFLIECGLCVEDKGRLKPGPNYTHLGSTSPLISKHHANWRVFAMQRHSSIMKEELAYSSLMSISKANSRRARELLAEAIKKINELRDDSEGEIVRCLGVDWVSL
jgi:uncharacterized protein (TIGR02147 family)